MKIVVFANGNRGAACLRALCGNKWPIDLVVADPKGEGKWYESVSAQAQKLGLEAILCENPNEKRTVNWLAERRPDLFVLAGYGRIFKKDLIRVPSMFSINLHAGKLPECRGSSPLNWALINGHESFTLSLIKVDEGIDSGDVILDRTFPIGLNDTIRELHATAEREFPSMLLEALSQIKNGACRFRKQDESKAAYYPLRFPDDGFILWDQLSAQEVHNRIRALTTPYPCAFTYFGKRRIKLLSSEIPTSNFFGEPGRVYRKTKEGFLVCAADKSLWIREAVFAEGGQLVASELKVYDSFSTLKGAVLNSFAGAFSDK